MTSSEPTKFAQFEGSTKQEVGFGIAYILFKFIIDGFQFEGTR